MANKQITGERRTLQVNITLTATERRMLTGLSGTTGLTMADVLRQAIRREHALLFGKRRAPRG
jgi:hypothetical protein